VSLDGVIQVHGGLPGLAQRDHEKRRSIIASMFC
jgi:hypothetical protein